MNSNKTLFLLTKTYPFGNGEQYITNELQELSEKFERIIIYPNDYYGKITVHTILLPNNIEVLNFNQNIPEISNNTLSDYLYLIKHAFLELFQTDDKRYFFKNFKWNLINFWTQLQISKKFIDHLKENNYNSLNSVFYSYWFSKSALFLAILKDKNVIDKFVSRAHSIDLYHNDWGIINDTVKVPSFKFFKMKNVSKIYPVSQHGALYLKQKFKKFSNKIELSYLGVPSNEKCNEIKNYKNAFHLVTCSGIDHNKRLHSLAEALLEIKQPIVWTHFGTGNLIEKLKQIAARFPDNILFHLKGNTPNNEIHKFYSENQVDLFVNLSIVEGLPVSIMEAMSYGIPVLATGVYGTPEAVIENQNGFLLNVNFTNQQLIDKLTFCIENKPQLLKMGTYSKEVFLKMFNSKNNYKQFANHLASL